MKSGPVIAILALGGLGGWQLSKSGSDAASPQTVAAMTEPSPTTSADTESAATTERLSQWDAGAVTLPRAADGQFYADAVIDGVSRRMLVDTGASVVALTGQDARAMGHMWQAADVRLVARSASGDVMGVPVTLRTVALGRIEQRSVPAVIVPEGLPVSLLGQSFLQRIDRVEIGPESMVIGG